MQKIATVQHWEPLIPAQLDSIVDGLRIVRKTRVSDQSLVSEILETNIHTRWEVCMALQGSDMAVHVKDGVTGVCAGDAGVDLSQSGNALVAACDRTRLLEALAALRENFVLQGQLIGPGIHGNPEKLAAPKFFVFDIYDMDRQSYLPPTQRKALVAQIAAAQRRLGASEVLEHAPVLAEHVSLADLGITSLDKLVAFADGVSLHAPVRQGVVFRRFDGRFGFKVLSTQHLLKSN